MVEVFFSSSDLLEQGLLKKVWDELKLRVAFGKQCGIFKRLCQDRGAPESRFPVK